MFSISSQLISCLSSWPHHSTDYRIRFSEPTVPCAEQEGWYGQWEQWLRLIVESFSIKAELTQKKKRKAVGPCFASERCNEKEKIYRTSAFFSVYKYRVFKLKPFCGLSLCAVLGAAVTHTNAWTLLTFVVFTLFPEMHDQPVRSGRTRHSSPSRQGSILHHHFWRTIAAGKKKTHSGGRSLYWQDLKDVFGRGREKNHNVVLESLSIRRQWSNWLTSLYFNKLHIHVRSEMSG